MRYTGTLPLTKLEEAGLFITNQIQGSYVLVGSIVPILFGRSRSVECISVWIQNETELSTEKLQSISDTMYIQPDQPFPKFLITDNTDHPVFENTTEIAYQFENTTECISIPDPTWYLDWIDITEQSKTRQEDFYHLARLFDKQDQAEKLKEAVFDSISEYPDHLVQNQESRFESIDIWVSYIKDSNPSEWKSQQKTVIDPQIESANALEGSFSTERNL